MVRDHNLELPQLPGFTWNAWFKDQSDLLRGLAKKANRNRRDREAMADNMDALPYEDLSELGICRSIQSVYQIHL